MVDGVYYARTPAAAMPFAATGANLPPQPTIQSQDFLAELVHQLDSPAPNRAAQLAAQQAQTPVDLDPQLAADIKQASKDMDGMVLYLLLKQMWATLPESPLFGSSLGSQFFREMWLEEIANTIASEEQDLGLSNAVEQELLSLYSNPNLPEAET